MPHKRMAIHVAVKDANAKLESAEPGTIGSASTLAELASAIGLETGSQTAVGMLHPELQDVILGAIKGAAGRPVNLTWRHDSMQGVHVRSPGPGELPIDIEIRSRFDEDRLGPPGTS